ncbi:MAG: OmpH family outer membrane protein [Spirochaetaceae bacterium]|jgi:outer membrane protein|nr:OmpH family outer membrane protein [Spirochaetaceae bacterium]
MRITISITKKIPAALLLLCVLGVKGLAAQQITRFGVVDTARVYSAYYRTTAAVRAYDARREEFQAEINRQTDQLKDIQARKLEYERSGNTGAALQLEGDIRKKMDFITDYSNSKNRELESMRTNLQKNDPFYTRLYGVLQKIAESEGFSMILSLQQSNGILWYSSAVDVTDKVIHELGL